MCGIAGVINRNNIPLGPEIRPILKAMGNQIAYRGPDDEQILTDGVQHYLPGGQRRNQLRKLVCQIVQNILTAFVQRGNVKREKKR